MKTPAQRPARLYVEWLAQPGLWAPLICEPAMRVGLARMEERASPGWRVLDVGCGQGQLVGALAQGGARSVGIDLDRGVLRLARQTYPQAMFAHGDVVALPFPDASFDAVFAFSVFQYMSRRQALAECARVLAPGGLFVCVENLAGNPIARAVRIWSRLAPSQRPKEHLAWCDRRIYQHYFSSVEYHPFHLTLLGLAGLPTVLRARAPRELVWAARPLYAVARRLDASLLRHFPGMSRWAWHGLICALR